MARRTPYKAAASTICEALNGEDLPTLAITLAIVTGCGGTSGHEQTFTAAWQRLRSAAGNPQPKRTHGGGNLYSLPDTA
jgi:hypothetical protein